MDRKRNDYILLFVKGVSMGVAEVIPGISGGTVALITGIYDDLVHAIKSIDLANLKLLAKGKVREFWKGIHGDFLATLGAGMMVGLFLLAQGVHLLFEHYSILIASFFFGLISLSGFLELRRIKKWDLTVVISFVGGVALCYALTLVAPLDSPAGVWFIFLTGALSVGALLVPGLSGIFILIVLGKYQYMLNALVSINIPVILLFVAGCLMGMTLFSRFLSKMLDNYHGATVALLAGFMLGALNKAWPWREAFEFVTNQRGEQVPVFDQSILPWNYLTTTGKDPQIFQAVLFMALGVFVVVLIEKIAARLKTKI